MELWHGWSKKKEVSGIIIILDFSLNYVDYFKIYLVNLLNKIYFLSVFRKIDFKRKMQKAIWINSKLNLPKHTHTNLRDRFTAMLVLGHLKPNVA